MNVKDNISYLHREIILASEDPEIEDNQTLLDMGQEI